MAQRPRPDLTANHSRSRPRTNNRDRNRGNRNEQETEPSDGIPFRRCSPTTPSPLAASSPLNNTSMPNSRDGDGESCDEDFQRLRFTVRSPLLLTTHQPARNENMHTPSSSDEQSSSFLSWTSSMYSESTWTDTTPSWLYSRSDVFTEEGPPRSRESNSSTDQFVRMPPRCRREICEHESSNYAGASTSNQILCTPPRPPPTVRQRNEESSNQHSPNNDQVQRTPEGQRWSSSPDTPYDYNRPRGPNSPPPIRRRNALRELLDRLERGELPHFGRGAFSARRELDLDNAPVAPPNPPMSRNPRDFFLISSRLSTASDEDLSSAPPSPCLDRFGPPPRRRRFRQRPRLRTPTPPLAYSTDTSGLDVSSHHYSSTSPPYRPVRFQ